MIINEWNLIFCRVWRSICSHGNIAYTLKITLMYIVFYFAALSRIENLSNMTPAVSREPSRHVYSLSQLRYVLSKKFHSYSCSLELGYVHKLYGEMPDTKNQCKKLPTRPEKTLETTGNVFSKPMQIHLELLYVASERSSKTKVGKQEKGNILPRAK